MSKNILSDTDYTKGWDNRFGVSVVVGKVSKIECSEERANVRVIMPDRVDHEGTPLISKPVPVLQQASKAKKSFAMPREKDNVLLVKLPNGTSNYVAIGSFYTKNDPPPVTDPLLDYCEWEGGHKETHDANEDADVFLKQEFQGGWDATIKKDVNLKTTDSAKFNIEADGDVLVKSATGNINVESPTGTVLIKQQTIDLQGSTIKLTGHVIIDGLITHTGNMETAGTHHDWIGYHTAGRSGMDTVEVVNTETWKWTTKLTDANNAGQVGLDATSWSAANTINLSMVTTGGRDMSTAFTNLFRIGNEMLLQAQADSTRYGRYTIIGEPMGHGGWWTVPVRPLISGGAPPTNNTPTTVTVIQQDDVIAKTAALDARIVQLEIRLAQFEEAHRNGS